MQDRQILQKRSRRLDRSIRELDLNYCEVTVSKSSDCVDAHVSVPSSPRTARGSNFAKGVPNEYRGLAVGQREERRWHYSYCCVAFRGNDAFLQGLNMRSHRSLFLN
jgi:hypothetical protein